MDRRTRLLVLVLLIGPFLFLGPRTTEATQESAPETTYTFGLIPGSGPAGMTVSAVGGGWTYNANHPYVILWETMGGTQLASFEPDTGGNFSVPITIPGGASNGSHNVIACEGYGGEFQVCATAAFTVLTPSLTPTPSRTRTPSPTPVPGFRSPTPTRTNTPTYFGVCRDGVASVSPILWEETGGVATHDMVLDVVITDSTTTHLEVHSAADDRIIYTRWPDPTPGTEVEAVPDPVEPNTWRVTIRNYPLILGMNLIRLQLVGGCRPSTAYFQFSNGTRPSPTPRADACGGLGFPPDASVLTFEGSQDYVEILAGRMGVRFETSMQILAPRDVVPRSAFQVGASREGLEFGSSMLPIRMAFDIPAQAIGLFVGLPTPYDVTGEVHANLTTYGYRGAGSDLVLLGTDTVSFPAAPTDLIHCLRFTADDGDFITRALIDFTSAGGVSIAERRFIDDLTVVRAEAELPPDRPPVVEITTPSEGASIAGTTLILRASIQEDRELADVRYQLDGGPETAVGASPSITDPTRYSTGVNMSSSLLEAGATHLLTVTAWDSAGQFGSDTVRILIPTPIPTLDIQAVKMEIVQVVQCLNNPRCVDNAVPMVTGKPTWVRLYVRAENGPPGRPVHGRLCLGRVTSCDTGYAVSFNTILPNGDEDPVAEDRDDLTATLNFILPPVWIPTAGRLELTAFVNYHEGDVDETRSDNNVVQAETMVIAPRALTVLFKPVTASGITAPLAEMWAIVDWLNRVFPVTRVLASGRAPLRGDFVLADSSGSGCGHDWGRLMDALRGEYSWGGRGEAYLFGMVQSGVETGGVGGCGETPGHVASGLVEAGNPIEGIIAAQELGHNFGRRHAPGCGAANPDRGYPLRVSLTDEWGLDPVARRLFNPREVYDYMGYCGGVDNSWTSVYTYLALIGVLPAVDSPSAGPGLAAPAGQDVQSVLIGGGSISPEAFVLERGFYHATIPSAVTDDLPDGPFTVYLLDADGAPLFQRTFGLIELSNGAPSETGFFQIQLPDLPGSASIVFVHGTTEVGRVSASANPPEIQLLFPVGGEDWGAEGAHEIAWQASDPDGDALRFNVQMSPDGGASWSSIAFDITESSLSVDSTELPGGALTFRVLASDGLNVAESSTTSPVTVGNKPPMIHIASPAEGDAFPMGEMAVLRGYAADLEDVALDEAAYRWSSDRDGDLGSGSTLWGLALSPGSHRITLTVTDTGGGSSSESVQITVGQPETPSARPSLLPLLLLLAGAALLVVAGLGIVLYMRSARR